jgi:enoyl-CoA hydratase/carnithine racemase
LQMAIGPGAARSLLMSGELIDGTTAHRLGLATHLSQSSESVHRDALEHCQNLAAKPPHALRVTKAWLNEIDGSLEDESFDQAASASMKLTSDAQAIAMLQSMWKTK